MNGIAEVRERYKEAVKQLIQFPTVAYHKGRVSGLEAALECLGVNSDERIKMFEACEEEMNDEREQEELDATKRPVSRARVEGKTAKTTAEYRRLAYQYEEQAKWGKALDYYNKAIEAYPKVTGPLAESDLDALKEKSEGIANFIKAERRAKA